ncbi:hypothetical protein ABWM37_26410 [Klebsiella michiganensis]|uniref:hypothetical protein n=1 Tax=Klebsiella michiganensis TaxID=1134687 RepID=UPI0037534A72
MKLFTRLFLILGVTLAGWSSVAWGYTGWCTPDNGTQAFSYNFGSKTVTDPAQNAPGTSFPDAFAWSLGGTYPSTCDCDPSFGGGRPTYFHTQTSLPVGHNDGQRQYYKVNDYLEVATSIYVSGAVADYVKEGANKQVISSQADSLIKISRIWADFFPANTSNQPI